MNTPPEEQWEMQVLHVARAFPYPETPDIAGVTRTALRRRHRMKRGWLRVAAVVILALLASILFVPEIRAGVLEALRIGAVRIFFSSEERPTSIPNIPSSESIESNNATLDNAGRLLGVPVRLPTYPPDLGLPNTVSVVGDAVVTLVWYFEGTEVARLVLQMIGAGVEVAKLGSPDALQVSVNDTLAAWLETPHRVEIYDSNGRELPSISWLVQSHVLVWVEGDITYRLETAQPLSEALAIAASLRPVSGD